MASLLVAIVSLSILTGSMTTGSQLTMDKRQTGNNCPLPAEDPTYPTFCLDAFAAIANGVQTLDITLPPSVLEETSANFTSKLSIFCTEECLLPQVEYLTCEGNTDALNEVVNGICATMGEAFCISRVLDGISSGQVSMSLYDPVHIEACTRNCTPDCFDILQASINYLGCCANGVFTPETSQELVSCQLPLPEPCPSNFTPAVTIPCINPEVDPNYPSGCADAFGGINAKLIKLFSANFTIQEVDESIMNISDLLVTFCSSECFEPYLNYSQCVTGDTATQESLASFQCGQNNEGFCLVETLTGISNGTIPTEILGTTFTQACIANCTNECRATVNSLMEQLGCCTSGLFPTQALFESCSLEIPANCPLVTPPTVTTATDRTPPTGRPMPTDRTIPTGAATGENDISPGTELNPAVSSAPSLATATIHMALTALLAIFYITPLKTIL